VSLTLTENVDVPAVVGVPEMEPFELSDKPFGSEPEVSDHVYGGTPPAAPNDAE
jgi:hypothetical protein